MEKKLADQAVNWITQAIPLMLDLPERQFWVDYDEEVDVLYVSFHRPQQATDTEMTEDGLLLRYRGDDLVGITVPDASTRVGKNFQ